MMFENLSHYRVTIVTGPQCSGTRIAAKMIAADTGHRYVDETAFDIHDAGKFTEMVRREIDVVIQAPGMSHLAQSFAANDDVLVVFVIRPLADIYESQRRIQWGSEKREARNYPMYTGPAAARKYEHWKLQKKMITHYREVRYNDLATHPLWVPKEKRRRFAPNQTEEK